MISFKRLLPKTMQNTKWGSLAEVWQSIWSDTKTDKAKLIFDQYDYESISDDDLKDLAIMFGFNLKSYTGYTSSSYYLKKQLETLVQRIKYKTTPICYQYQGIPYTLISNGYSVIYDDTTQLYSVDEALIGSAYLGTTRLDREDPGNQYYVSIVNCDSDLTTDSNPTYYSDTMQIVLIPPAEVLDEAYLDVYYFPTLDGSTYLYSLTRNFVFDYIHKFVESETEFLSINSLKALHNDINQFKRITDRCYFEPYLFFEFEGSGIPTYKQWTDYSGGSVVNQTNISYTDQFADFTQIRFGNGAHTSFSGITDVNSFIFGIDYNNLTNKIIESDEHYNFRTLISEGGSYSGIVTGQHFSGFTEIAIWDSASGCILYSTFPKVQWEDTMFTNIKFDFQII